MIERNENLHFMDACRINGFLNRRENTAAGGKESDQEMKKM